MNDIAENIDDRVAMRRLGAVILGMCGIALGLIVAAALVSHQL